MMKPSFIAVLLCAVMLSPAAAALSPREFQDTVSGFRMPFLRITGGDAGTDPETADVCQDPWDCCYSPARERPWECSVSCPSGQTVDSSTCFQYDARPRSSISNWCNPFALNSNGNPYCGNACLCVGAGDDVEYSSDECDWIGFECDGSLSQECRAIGGSLQVINEQSCTYGCDGGTGRCQSAPVVDEDETSTPQEGLMGEWVKATIPSKTNYVVGEEVVLEAQFRNPPNPFFGDAYNDFFLQAELVPDTGFLITFPIAGDICNEGHEGNFANAWIGVVQDETVTLQFKLYPEQTGEYEIWVSWIAGGCGGRAVKQRKATGFKITPLPHFIDSITVSEADPFSTTTVPTTTITPVTTSTLDPVDPCKDLEATCSNGEQPPGCGGHSLALIKPRVCLNNKTSFDCVDEITYNCAGSCSASTGRCSGSGGIPPTPRGGTQTTTTVPNVVPNITCTSSTCSFERKCSDDTHMQLCYDFNKDGCNEVRTYLCDPGKSCKNGYCKAAAAEEDLQNQTQEGEEEEEPETETMWGGVSTWFAGLTTLERVLLAAAIVGAVIVFFIILGSAILSSQNKRGGGLK